MKEAAVASDMCAEMSLTGLLLIVQYYLLYVIAYALLLITLSLAEDSDQISKLFDDAIQHA